MEDKQFMVSNGNILMNKSYIIYCGYKNEDDELETFRYTQDQRRLELGIKKYRKIIHKVNTETKINNKSTLSSFNSKL